MKQAFISNAGSGQQESLEAIKLRTQKNAMFLLRQKNGPSFQAYPGLEQTKCKDSELIRDMSNLPGFLQQAKDKSAQDKALNFGVLDWKQLEKWKYTERMPGKCSKKTTSRSVFPTNGVHRIDPNAARQNASGSPPQIQCAAVKSTGNEEFNGSCSFNSGRVHQDSPTSISEWSQSNGSWLSNDDVQSSPVSSDASTKQNVSSSPNDEVEKPVTSLKKSEAKLSSMMQSLYKSEFDGGPSTKERKSLWDSTLKSSPSKSEALGSNAGVKGRSKSPIRKLFDPFLKHKIVQTPAAVRPPETCKGPSQNRKTVVSKVQALLQLHMKNGLPFYKFVVETSNSMLIAAAKKVQVSSGSQDDIHMSYTFYSVREIKKKNTSWIISRGSSSENSKSCSVAYTVIGQMRFSRKCDSRECVLYGADPNTEETAAIVTSPKDRLGGGTVLVLPGGTHGLPTKGPPPSLIGRWRSGSCDCGGWDAGCKLEILSELQESRDVDRLNLFSTQVLQHRKGKQQQPKLRMEPVRGGMYYDVEFLDTVSLLVAFGTCVAHLSCRKYEGMIDAAEPCRAIVDRKKHQLNNASSCPPLSPVGRI